MARKVRSRTHAAGARTSRKLSARTGQTASQPQALAGKKQKIAFKYIYSDTYNPVYANGAVGGLSTQGEIVANFYLERQPVLRSQVHDLTPDGQLGDEISRDPPATDLQVVRFVTTGVVLSLETARRVHDWLGKAIVQLDQAKVHLDQVKQQLGKKK